MIPAVFGPDRLRETPMDRTITSEGDVLVATVKYLVRERNVLPYRISMASGEGVDHDSTKTKIKGL